MAIQYYQILQTGDRLWVGAELELRLERDDGTVLVIGPGDSPYTVENTGEPPGVWENLMTWAGVWLHGKDHEGKTRPTVSLVTRSDSPPIVLPLAPTMPVRLMAGERPLNLAWTGGAPPFQVRLLPENEETVLLDQQNIPTRHFQTPLLELAPGAYQLIISDQNHQAEIAVEMVAASALPTPVGLTLPTDTDSAHGIVYAVWLTAQDDSWLLEAYQRAAFWQDQHQPAKWLRYVLEQGERPQPPEPMPAPSTTE